MEGWFRCCLLIVDGTECPVEKPLDDHIRSLLWSGKKGFPTLMYEVGACVTSGEIVYFHGPYPGSQNDWGMHRYYNMYHHMLPGELWFGDLGYLGFSHLVVPFKRISTQIRLSPAQDEFNQELSSLWVLVENVIGRIKTFKCVATTFRHDLHLHTKFFNVAAQLTNIRLRVDPLRADPTDDIVVRV